MMGMIGHASVMGMIEHTSAGPLGTRVSTKVLNPLRACFIHLLQVH
jgi:hypothetical protein